MENLPYSVKEIYGIHTSGKYAGLKQVYHEFYHIYDYEKEPAVSDVKQILTEDSNSGFDFFRGMSNGKYKCESAKGKSNIYLKLLQTKDNTLVVADGAAFGSQMAKIMRVISSRKNALLFLPESFEYILLQAELIKDSELSSIIATPEDYIDSKKYFSWEQFFTSFISEKTKDSFLKYSKKKLNKNYLSESIKSKILNSKAFTRIKGLFD